MLHDSSCDLPFLRVASSAFMNMMVSSPEHKPIAASNVWRLQREHAHMAWLKIFGDEPLHLLFIQYNKLFHYHFNAQILND